jgi:hypothetical protein
MVKYSRIGKNIDEVSYIFLLLRDQDGFAVQASQ